MSAVFVEGVTKTYGELIAVEEFGFQAGEGEIVALAGPDGAGKTTLFRAMCGLIGFDSGRIEIMDQNLQSDFDRIKDVLGYMPQNFSLYPDLSVEENLRFYAGLFGTDRRRFDEKKEPLYEFSGLGPFRTRRAGHLSGGMKQKLALSCALIHEPKVLILDEPTTGVDPLSRRQFWDILKSLRDSGASIVVSTPYMDEIERADRAIFIHRGKKLAEGTPGELTGRYEGNVFLVTVDPTGKRVQDMSQIQGIEVRRFGSALHVYTSHDMNTDTLREKLRRIDISPDAVMQVTPELEDTFIQLMGA